MRQWSLDQLLSFYLRRCPPHLLLLEVATSRAAWLLLGIQNEYIGDNALGHEPLEAGGGQRPKWCPDGGDPSTPLDLPSG